MDKEKLKDIVNRSGNDSYIQEIEDNEELRNILKSRDVFSRQFFISSSSSLASLLTRPAVRRYVEESCEISIMMTANDATSYKDVGYILVIRDMKQWNKLKWSDR